MDARSEESLDDLEVVVFIKLELVKAGASEVSVVASLVG